MCYGKDLVSIIIPVYNVEKYLNDCVNSVINQTYSNCEIFLVDDGSTDSSGALCDIWQHKDKRITVIHKENGGLSSARNIGMEKAKGKFIYFLDSDDYISLNAIESLVSKIENEKADVVFFDANVFSEDEELLSNVNKEVYLRKKKYLTKNGIEQLRCLLDSNEYSSAVPLFFYSKEYLSSNNIKFIEGILHEDECFSFYVFARNGRIAHLSEPLYFYRKRSNSIVTSCDNKLKKFTSMVEIYYEVSKILSDYSVKDDKEILRKYVLRIVNTVFRKWDVLTSEDKEENISIYSRFVCDLKAKDCFGDIRTKIICSTGIKKTFYRVLLKIEKIGGK